MLSYRRSLVGFTLVELLVVLAILLVLTSVLYPVFASARSAAKKATCQSNFHQAQLASMLYVVDYDERLMPVNHQPALPANSKIDRTWVQLILPYLKSFSLFRCPSDYGSRPAPEATFDQDLVPGDTDSRYYTASLRSNLGYNYLYLAPIYKDRASRWIAQPRALAEVSDSSRTLLYVDSVWELDSNGVPFGGGSWLVLPPCRYAQLGTKRYDTFRLDSGDGDVYTPDRYWGWRVDSNISAGQYGYTWPWHEGRMNVVRLDGSVRPMTPGQLTLGCQVRDKWGGYVENSSDYIWDLN